MYVPPFFTFFPAKFSILVLYRGVPFVCVLYDVFYFHVILFVFYICVVFLCCINVCYFFVFYFSCFFRIVFFVLYFFVFSCCIVLTKGVLYELNACFIFSCCIIINPYLFNIFFSSCVKLFFIYS